jgi:hypothetical protein
VTLREAKKTRPYRDFLKLLGRWGGFGDPRKLKVLGRRMVRRVGKLMVRKHGAE